MYIYNIFRASQAHPKAAPFRFQAMPHYNLMNVMLVGKLATGKFAVASSATNIHCETAEAIVPDLTATVTPAEKRVRVKKNDEIVGVVKKILQLQQDQSKKPSLLIQAMQSFDDIVSSANSIYELSSIQNFQMKNIFQNPTEEHYEEFR